MINSEDGFRDLWNTISHDRICTIDVPEKEERDRFERSRVKKIQGQSIIVVCFVLGIFVGFSM